jgi:site-specific recombinase XerD
MRVSSVSVSNPPIVTIFVRHAEDCRYRGDEFHKGCRCRKHLRWSHAGKQYRQAAKTRSWGEAERVKRQIEERFGGAAAAGESIGAIRVDADSRKTIERAIKLFLDDKRNEGVGDSVIKKYDRELGRLREFMEHRSKFFPAEIAHDDLTEFRSGWENLYPSTQTRSRVLTRLRAFLRYCFEREWIERIPRIASIKIEEQPTLPFTDAQYIKILATIPKEFAAVKAKRVHALVQLMRHSGLAIRDAVTLERDEIVKDTKKKLYRIVTRRTKTGTHVSVPIPPEVADEVLAVLNDNPRYVFWNTGTGKEQSLVTNWQHDLRQMFRAAGLPDGHPHQLRDTFAVSLLKKGVPIEEVSKALGHESIKTTEKHYGPWVESRQDRLDSMIVGSWDTK